MRALTSPDILKTEKFGYFKWESMEECFECGRIICFENNEYVFDRFGRIFCCDECKSCERTEEL